MMLIMLLLLLIVTDYDWALDSWLRRIGLRLSVEGGSVVLLFFEELIL